MKTGIPYLIALGALLFFTGCSTTAKAERKAASAGIMQTAEYKEALHIMFSVDGHQYTAFVVAGFANLPEDEKYALTYYTQYPDIDWRYDAVWAGILYAPFPWWWGWRSDIMGRLHSLHGGKAEAVAQRRSSLAGLVEKKHKEPGPKAWRETGMVIHALGDSYAHTKGEYLQKSEHAYGVLVGHAFAGHHPDEIAHSDVFPKYAAYVRALFAALDPTENAEGKARMEDFLARMAQFACAKGQDCDDAAIERLQEAISMEVGRSGFNPAKFAVLTKSPRLPKPEVKKVIDEIKRAHR